MKGLMKGYWLVWVRKLIEKDRWISKVMQTYEDYVKSGSCIVHYLKTPHAVFEDSKVFPSSICKFPSLEKAVSTVKSKDYMEGILAAVRKPVDEMVL